MKRLFKKILLGTSILTIASSSLLAQNQNYTRFVKVDYSEPIYSYVSKNVKECYEVPVHKEFRPNKSSHNDNSIGLDTIVGATIGVVVGNQIGKGNGRTAAKIAGGLIGAAVANNTRDSRNEYNEVRYNSYAEPKYETTYETRCETKKYHKKEKIITGYKNYFSFNGEEYTKITEHPKRKIRVTQTISF